MLQWGKSSNELGLIRQPNVVDLGDARFHWKITNPFDVMLFKYPDVVSNSKIEYDFGGRRGPYEFRL